LKLLTVFIFRSKVTNEYKSKLYRQFINAIEIATTYKRIK